MNKGLIWEGAGGLAEDGVRLTTEGGLGIRGGRGGRGDPGLGAEAVKVAPAAESAYGCCCGSRMDSTRRGSVTIARLVVDSFCSPPEAANASVCRTGGSEGTRGHGPLLMSEHSHRTLSVACLVRSIVWALPLEPLAAVLR